MTTVHITSINEFPSSGRVQLIFDLIKNLRTNKGKQRTQS